MPTDSLARDISISIYNNIMEVTKIKVENLEILYRELVWKRYDTIGKLIRVGPIEAQINNYPLNGNNIIWP